MSTRDLLSKASTGAANRAAPVCLMAWHRRPFVDCSRRKFGWIRVGLTLTVVSRHVHLSKHIIGIANTEQTQLKNESNHGQTIFKIHNFIGFFLPEFMDDGLPGC